MWSVAFVLLGAAPAAGDYFPPADPRAGGIRDLMLIYLSKDSWPQDDFLPYVATKCSAVGSRSAFPTST